MFTLLNVLAHIEQGKMREYKYEDAACQYHENIRTQFRKNKGLLKKKLKEMNHLDVLIKNRDSLSRKAFEKDPDAANYFRSYIENQTDAQTMSLTSYSGGFPADCIFD